LLKVSIPEGVTIKDYTLDEPELSVDALKMERIFANILRNSVEAIPKEGTIEIRSVQKGSNVEISFADSGVGIPAMVLAKIFSPLNTTKAKGMGLSLAIGKRIVEEHDGKIAVASTVGKGTVVTITLPLEPKLEVNTRNVCVTNCSRLSS